MNSMYGTEDPFENGWASAEAPDTSFGASSTAYPSSSTYLTASQLLQSNDQAPTSTVDVTSKAPAHYREVFDKLRSNLSGVNELEAYLFSPLVTEKYLTSYQCSRIIDTLYDHNLLPADNENNFFQILGLVALELDVTGSGDYVTLQFKLNSGLPPLPRPVLDLLLSDGGSEPQILHQSLELDPLSSQLANTSLDTSPRKDWAPLPDHDPLLADHSALLIDPDATGPESIHVNDIPYISKYVTDIRDTFKPLVALNSALKIKEIPEKEGLVFKHINYAITHNINFGTHGPGGTKKVVRRYSDFVWLLEFLLKKYPFRVIPGLPPKKFTGMYIRFVPQRLLTNPVGTSPDSQFLQRRRRGLYRFLNQLVKHPVLRQEPIVISFLSVPTDLVSWRKQARVDYSLEFKGQKILTNFINSIWPSIGEEFLTNWKNAESNIAKIIEVWTKVVMLVERYEKRQQQIAFDNSKFVEMMTRFNDLDESLYPHKNGDNEKKVISMLNRDDTSSLNDSLACISGFFNKTSTILIDESYVINTTVLEKFKNYLDYLYSLQELFDRLKKLSINTIPQLQQKIHENEQRYDKLSKDDADIKGSELVKLRQAIINDKQEMFQQLNKDWLIKSCCFEEYIMFQETQFLVSEAWSDWCKGRYKFQDKLSSLFDALNNEVVPDMPLGR